MTEACCVCVSNEKHHKLSRRLILFAAAIRQVVNVDSLSKKIPYKVTEAQADALRFLAMNNDVKMSEISIGLGYTISGATKSVNRLEQNGWILRYNKGKDNREVRVHLTEEGETIAKILLHEAENQLLSILNRLQHKTIENLDSTLEEFLCDFIENDEVAQKLCKACGYEGGIHCRETDIDCVVAKTVQQLDGHHEAVSTV